MRKLWLTGALLLAAISVRADQLLPIAEGTTWEYDSVETITGAPVRSVVTVRVGRQLFDGKEVAKFEAVSNNVVLKTDLMTVDENGIACLARSGRDGKMIRLDPPETIVPAPLTVGATWNQASDVDGIRMQQRWKVVAEEDVTVPAQKFRAFHLQCEDPSFLSIKLDKWFVPGTGFVKEVTKVKGLGMLQLVTLELQKRTEAVAKSVPMPSAVTPSRLETQPDSIPNVVPASVPAATPGDVATQPEAHPASPDKKLLVEVSGDSAGGAMKTEFKSNVANIYVRWRGQGLPVGAIVRVAWIAQDVGDLVEPNFIVDETETVASAPDSGARFTLGRPPDGWAEGKYRVEFYVDDALTETVRVTIGK